MEKITEEVINFKRRDFIEKRVRYYYGIQGYYDEEGLKEIIDMHI